jgi:hypothetical protein
LSSPSRELIPTSVSEGPICSSQSKKQLWEQSERKRLNREDWEADKWQEGSRREESNGRLSMVLQPARTVLSSIPDGSRASDAGADCIWKNTHATALDSSALSRRTREGLARQRFLKSGEYSYFIVRLTFVLTCPYRCSISYRRNKARQYAKFADSGQHDSTLFPHSLVVPMF